MRNAVVAFSAIALATSAGCWSSDGPEVVVYTAHDAEFSKPIFVEFTKSTGIRVLPKFDTESTKTVGLAEAIIAEKANPRCDVFWNNELLHSLRLERLGLAEAYRPRLAAEYPVEFRSPRGMWHGFAAPVRVLLVNTRLVPADDRPTSIYDLADARWRGKVGIAKPLFGTTATHAACLFAALGDDEAKKFFERLKSTAEVMAGNRHVAQAVGGGQLAFGLTDTDDAMAEVEAGRPVTIIYPDQKPDQFGTLFIPNTLVIVANCPHQDEARRLVDYLLTPEVEGVLAAGPAAQIPLHPDCPVKARVATPKTVRTMQVDFAVAGEKWDAASRWLRDKFTSP